MLILKLQIVRNFHFHWNPKRHRASRVRYTLKIIPFLTVSRAFWAIISLVENSFEILMVSARILCNWHQTETVCLQSSVVGTNEQVKIKPTMNEAKTKTRQRQREKEGEKEDREEKTFGFPTNSLLIKLYWQLFWHKFRILYGSIGGQRLYKTKAKKRIIILLLYCTLYATLILSLILTHTERHTHQNSLQEKVNKNARTKATEQKERTRQKKISDNNCHKIRVLAQYEQRVDTNFYARQRFVMYFSTHTIQYV